MGLINIPCYGFNGCIPHNSCKQAFPRKAVTFSILDKMELVYFHIFNYSIPSFHYTDRLQFTDRYRYNNFASPDRLHQGFYSPTHPYDSMKEIWSMPISFICEIIIALIIYFIGVLNTFVYRKLSTLRHKRRVKMNDIYTEE